MPSLDQMHLSDHTQSQGQTLDASLKLAIMLRLQTQYIDLLGSAEISSSNKSISLQSGRGHGVSKTPLHVKNDELTMRCGNKASEHLSFTITSEREHGDGFSSL